LVILWSFLLALPFLNPTGFRLPCFHFHLSLCIFWFPFLFLLWFLGYSEACCLASICLYFCVVYCDFSIFIFNFVDLILLPFYLISLANGLSIVFILSKNQLLVLLIFCYSLLCFFFIYFCLIFIISFLLLTLYLNT